MRLARFNVTVEKEGDKPEFFCGLPIPVQAAAIVTLILNVERLEWFEQDANSISLLIPVVAILAGLMVSNIPFDALPRPNIAYVRKRPYKMAALLLGLVLTVSFQHIGLLISIATYIIYGVCQGIIGTIKEVMRT